ncbi:LDH2 family malate/lactate/ureidoglycolate dehydrogenase [Rhodoligotrophos appendicifer]|uniref:Ldh family oxidoreductase n=1 Tax=Rhodoligotrophos appendicifer TaxID=987056 RepID=UPI001185BF44|nr:Ldh family oxidoreductase [Rhodoligotrophos appendicifer]
MRVPVEDLHQIYKAFARSRGADEAETALFADGLLRADLRGHHTQGAGLLPYLDGLFDEGIMHFGRPTAIVRETSATALLDGHGGAGHVVAARAMDIAISKARDSGIGFVTAKRSSDCGMAANYALQALDHGMIGIAMSTGPILVAPWGGREAQFCTNPLALAVPAGTEEPIVIDMATSAGSMGAVVLAARDGRMLPGLDVVDADGRYTNDPLRVILNVMDRESRMSGALLPAGPKMFGMVLFVEILSALLSGERDWGDATVSDSTRGRAAFYSQTCIAIDVACFQDTETFAATADRMIRTLSSMTPAEGFSAVRLHGAGARAKESEYRDKGILLRDEEWEMIRALVQRHGLDLRDSANS